MQTVDNDIPPPPDSFFEALEAIIKILPEDTRLIDISYLIDKILSAYEISNEDAVDVMMTVFAGREDCHVVSEEDFISMMGRKN